MGAMSGSGIETGTGTWTSGHDLRGAATSETKWNAACSPPGALTVTLSDSVTHSVGLLDDAVSAIAEIETAASDLAELGTMAGFGFGYGFGGEPYLPTMTWNGKWRSVSATDDLPGLSRETNQHDGP